MGSKSVSAKVQEQRGMRKGARVEGQRGGGAKAEGYKRNVHVKTDQNNPFTDMKAYDIIKKDYLPASAMPDEL